MTWATTNRFIAAAGLLMLHAVTGDAQQVFGRFAVTASSTAGWTLSYVSSVHPVGSVTIGGRSYLRYENVGNLPGPPGSPGLPVDVVNIAVPFGATISVELRDVVYETLLNSWIAPNPTLIPGPGGEAVAQYVVDKMAYAEKSFTPSSQISVGKQFTFRQQRLCPIRVAPLQYNPADHIVRRIVRATVVAHLTAVPALGRVSPTPTQDPLVESTYRRFALNYEQGKQWRRAPLARTLGAAVDSTRDWFDPLAPYVKMGILQDGWYRVTKQALLALGASPDLATARLFQRGVELPALVEGDSALNFYALRNRGDSTYYDFYSDTGCVWLTWGGSAGTRYVESASPSTVQHTIVSAMATSHFERNTDYYLGTGLEEISSIYDVPGEGWVWDYYYPGDARDHAFAVDNVDTSVVKTATIAARLYGMTSHLSTPDHIAALILNGTSIGQVSFNGREGAWPSYTVPAGSLSAASTLRIQSVPTAAPVNEFYLDWFALTYCRKLVALHDSLQFSVSPADASPASRFRVQGFSSGDVIVADLTNGRVLHPDSLVNETNGTVTVVFSDTVSVARSYQVLARSAALQPVTMAQKQFVNLRSLPGADYIVLAHPLFLHAANVLAEQREITRSIRAQVVNVADVYDEFNYGIISPYAIKRFLQYAYQNWPPPAPSNLVIVGDASWDPHHYMPATTMTDFIPAFGVPSSDDWYACFDTALPFIPSMFIGRLTVMDSLQAESVVSKIIAYDGTMPGAWDKRMLFMTAGSDTSENLAFAQTSNNVIATYTAPAPLGAENIRAYKTTPASIDGSMTPMLMQTFNNGIAFVSFLGHSGGRFWGLDAGSPYDLQNTAGQWPFIASVSCNVGAFATPTGMVLAEDYLLADHRGGIAVWASASLGYPTYGTLLVQDFLGQMIQGERQLGAATTASRIELWTQGGNNYITIAHQYLTPLIGDPLSKFAVPVKPDLALTPSEIETDPSQPTTSDSVVSVKVHIRNFGTVPSVAGTLNVSDTYGGNTTTVVQGGSIPRVYYLDSTVIPWHPGLNAGQHTLAIAVALPDSIQEVSLSNNTITYDRYVYANALQAIRPFNGQVIAPGSAHLVVAAPAGVATAGFSYTFEIDSVVTFDSPLHASSPAVSPLPASGEWTTPSLPPSTTFYWRARTVSASGNGRWMNANFSTSSGLPTPPLVRWEQHRQDQFAGDAFLNATSSDSGISLAAGPATLIKARSLGHLANMGIDYYTTLQVGLDLIRGYWWNIGNSYMTVRVNDFDGSYVFRPFDLSVPANADSMAAFITNTATGMYLGIVAMAYGRTNVDEALYSAIEGLGSQHIRQVQDGEAWALIARKGYPGSTIEGYQPDSVTIAQQLPTYYGTGGGTVVSPLLPVPVRWDSFRWQTATSPGLTSIAGWMIGIRKAGGVDTLKRFTADSGTVSLADANTNLLSYAGFKLGASLTTHESSITPRILSWSADFEPPADLALVKLIQDGDLVVPRGTPVNIPLSAYNLGYRRADSTILNVGMYDATNTIVPLFSVPGGGIAVDSGRSMTVSVPTGNLSHRVSLELSIAPVDSSGDLYPGNNSFGFAFTVTGTPIGTIDVFADGVGLMDGDYVAQSPKLLVRPRLSSSTPTGQTEGALIVDGMVLEPSRPLVDGEVSFTPKLEPGRHLLTIVLMERSTNGIVDTLKRGLNVTVSDQLQILRAYNFPNPFSTRTEFTFVLTGSGAPDAARIRIYTVAGRKIRDMALNPGDVVVGFNRIPWDGRDEDGDLLANGVYFYQIEVSVGGKTVSVLGKLAKVQ